MTLKVAGPALFYQTFFILMPQKLDGVQLADEALAESADISGVATKNYISTIFCCNSFPCPPLSTLCLNLYHAIPIQNLLFFPASVFDAIPEHTGPAR